jgi:hypothetical protein
MYVETASCHVINTSFIYNASWIKCGGNSGIIFKSTSKIYDDNNLKIYTDDNTYINSSSSVYLNTSNVYCSGSLTADDITTDRIKINNYVSFPAVFCEVYGGNIATLDAGYAMTNECTVVDEYNPTSSYGWSTTDHIYYAPVKGLYTCTWNGRQSDGGSNYLIIYRRISGTYTSVITDTTGRQYWVQSDGTSNVRRSFSISMNLRLNVGEGIALVNYYSTIELEAIHHCVVLLGTYT